MVNGFIFAVYIFFVVINLCYGVISLRIKGKTKGLIISPTFIIKYENILAFCLMILLIIISCNARNIPDYESYKEIYYTDGYLTEIGYTFMQNIAHYLKFPFLLFRNFVLVITFLLIWIAVNNLGLNKNIVFALYSLYPFSFDVIQIRNSLAMSIVLISFGFLLKGKKYCKIKFLLGIVFSSLFHSLSIVYIVCLIIDTNIERRKLKKQILIIAFLFIILISVLFKIVPGFDNLLNSMFYSFNYKKAQSYITGDMGWGFTIYWLMQLLYIISSYYCNRGLNQFHHRADSCNLLRSKSIGLYMSQLLWINLVMTFAFPLLTININFYRIYRNLSILNYGILYGTFYIERGKNKVLALIYFYMAVCLNIFMNYYNQLENVFLSLFNF